MKAKPNIAVTQALKPNISLQHTMKITLITLAVLLLAPLNSLTAADVPRPNIIVIYTSPAFAPVA